MIKVAMIGAGSIVFSKNLTGDILSFPEFRDATFSYMDIDPDRLEVHSGISKRLRPERRLPASPPVRLAAFASGAEDLFDEQHPPSSPHVEDDLIGTREPLRFVYYRRAMGIDTLRETIARVFTAQRSAQVLPIGHGHGARPMPVRTPARKVA